MLLTAGLVLPAAAAEVPLREEAHINNSLMAAAVGDAIRKNCSDIYARMVTVYFKAKALENYAREKGYTEAEVRAFLDSKEEKKRVLAVAESYMAEHGVIAGDEASYCRLGRAEIAAQSLIGSLLGLR
jgi:hypothetical protein